MIKFNPTTMDAEMPRGDTGDFTIKPTINKIPFLSDGDKVYFTLRKTKDKSVVLQKEITTFDNGLAVIPLPPADTKYLDVGNYVYGIDIIRADGTKDNITPNWEARFTLKRGVKE